MKLLTTILFTSFLFGISFSQTSLQGFFRDAETNEPIIFGTIAIYQNDVLITGAQSDFDGYYSIDGLLPVSYDVVFSHTGYQDQRVTGLAIIEGKSNILDMEIPNYKHSGCCSCYIYDPPLISLDETTQGFIFKADQISKMAIRW